MPTILCYGDSNTWGTDPDGGARFPEPKRWPGVLRRQLPDAWVVEEGLPGRTTVQDDPVDPGLNGAPYLASCLPSHAPIDLVAIMLGTNDTKVWFPLDAGGIAAGAARLVDLVTRSGAGPGGAAPQVLLIAPPALGALGALQEVWGFGPASIERSRGLARLYRALAENRGCGFLDAAGATGVSPVDGVHLDAAGHERLGVAVAQAIRGMRRPGRGP